MGLGVILAAFLGVMIAVPIMAFDCKPFNVYFISLVLADLCTSDTRLPSWPGPCLGLGQLLLLNLIFVHALQSSYWEGVGCRTEVHHCFLCIANVWKSRIPGLRLDLTSAFLQGGRFYCDSINHVPGITTQETGCLEWHGQHIPQGWHVLFFSYYISELVSVLAGTSSELLANI
jgi:hypothetical protein